MSAWVLTGILGCLSILACWSLAGVLFRVGAPGSAARMLAWVLVAEGAALVTAGFPEMVLNLPIDELYQNYPAYMHISFIAHTVADAAMLALYPPFLALALQTWLTRPFASKGMRIALGVAAVVLVLSVQLSAWEIGATLLYGSLSLLFAFALIASIHAWRVATRVNRTRAGVFALAFGLRDVCWGLVYAASIWMVWSGTYLDGDASGLELPVKVIYALGTLFAVPLIAYGILRTQLFDIDLRIRWTLKQSTVAAVFVAVFYVVSEGADRFFSSELGNVYGLLASALVVFFLVPLQRFAERVASAAMPNTEDTPEYVMYRKLQVYESALSEALVEGGISAKERALLDHLRGALGISSTAAEALERDLLQAGGAPAA